MDRRRSQIRLTVKNSLRRKNGGKANKRKIKTDNAGLDDDRWIWRAYREAPAVRGVTTSYI